MVPMPSQVIERRPNWLPIPGAISAQEKRSQRVDEDDLFRKGEVVIFQPKQGHGVVANDRGDRLPFDLRQIAVIGGAENIGVGLRIGYDVARTSSGYRVTTLKVY